MVVIRSKLLKILLIASLLLIAAFGYAKDNENESGDIYKKRVLENIEIDFLSSYYAQDGNNAAVCGGDGTEELIDINPTIVISIPINDDDILTLDLSISAYTSASSSNINPFDDSSADPFQASSGASSSDVWANLTGIYSHSSNDRNNVWSAKLTISTEYDYFSVGFGGSYTKLFNQKNTEVSLTSNIFIDTWHAIYPSELRPFKPGGDSLNNSMFTQNIITGNTDYNPSFTEFNSETRNSYSLGFGFSQILSKRLQTSWELDLVQQQGLLSAPFQRVYFSDAADSFIENFQLADDIERLPNTRTKVALGGRLNYYVNESFVLRSYYRYYFDDWSIFSNTAALEIPIKITGKFTLYPSYRYYFQTAAKYFAPYEQHLSSNEFYTSDYDLSRFSANQFGFGVTYTDIFTKFRIWKFGLKSIDIKFNQYERDSGFKASIIAGAFNFVMD